MKKIAIIPSLLTASLLSGCAMHSTSRDWNGLAGMDGNPTYYKTTSKVALKLFIVVPFVGDTSIDGLVDDLTEDIKNEKGNFVRIVQAGNENYWYGYPPLSWIVTPVISTVAAEYRPDAAAYVADQEAIRLKKESWQKYNPMEL
jgi:hypothetical protein